MQGSTEQCLIQARKVEHAVQQRYQRSVVEERIRRLRLPVPEQPAEGQQREPSCPRSQHAERVGAVHLFRGDVLPQAQDFLQAFVEVISVARKGSGIDGAGGRTGDDVVGIAFGGPAGIAQNGRNTIKHTDLVCCPRPASGQDESRFLLLSHSNEISRRYGIWGGSL